MTRGRALIAIVLVSGAGGACHASTENPVTTDRADAGASPLPGGGGASRAHSSSMALRPDGTLFVANPETDTVSVVDVGAHKLMGEILLAAARPVPDAVSGAFAPGTMPRSVALSPDGKTLYVTGERSGNLYAVDIASSQVRGTITVGSEPVGVLVSADGASVFVANSQDATVSRVAASTLTITGTVRVAEKPWALAWAPDGAKLVVTHLLGPGVTVIDPIAMTASNTWPIPNMAPRGDRRLAHGEVRGLYDAAARPGSNEIWMAHTLLGTDTPQPALDFASTAFPALSLVRDNGAFEVTLTTDAQDVPGIDGSFADVVSGPHALTFTKDGAFALIVDANSEDVLVVDAQTRTEKSVVRGLPGRMPDGIILSGDEQFAYVDERVSGDVAVLKLDRSVNGLTVSVAGSAIARLGGDPMPALFRLGQSVFNSANSAQYPLTTDHWIACATCHMEGRSDAVTWKFAQGPRDTPSNAGGTLGTGFLFRTADRTKVQDYWHTINVEQGGRFSGDDPNQSALLDALAAYVNYAIPLPVPPETDPVRVGEGATVFRKAGCGTCHSGARLTDSAGGNPTLDLAGPILLHDVGSCAQVSSPYPDVAHQDLAGHARAACAFDTPSLNGLASSPPYLHDGSAATIAESVTAHMSQMGQPALLPDDAAALIEYLRSL